MAGEVSRPFAQLSVKEPQALVDELFRSHKVHNIQSTRKDLKREMAMKQEEMREKVGGHYRDLIDSAEGIQSLQSVCARTVAACKGLVLACEHMQAVIEGEEVVAEGRRGSGHEGDAEGELSELAFAQRAHFVLDTAEETWQHLETGDIQRAAMRYLTAARVNDTIRHHAALNKKVPVVQSQWKVVATLPASITQACRSTIATPHKQLKEYAEGLLGLAVFEDLGTTQLLNLLLQSRSHWVQAAPKQTPSDHSSPILHALDLMAHTVRTTITDVCTLFGLGGSGAAQRGLLWTTGKAWLDHPVAFEHTGMEAGGAGAGGGEAVREAVHAEVWAVVERLNAGQSYLSALARTWLYGNDKEAGILTVVQQLCLEMLNQVPTATELVGLKDAVQHRLSLPRQLANATEQELQTKLLGRPLDVWGSVFESVFARRGAVIVSEGLSRIALHSQFAHACTELAGGDCDLSEERWGSAVFAKGSQHVPGDVNAIVATASSALAPAVARICNEFEGLVSDALKGVSDVFLHQEHLHLHVVGKQGEEEPKGDGPRVSVGPLVEMFEAIDARLRAMGQSLQSFADLSESARQTLLLDLEMHLHLCSHLCSPAPQNSLPSLLSLLHQLTTRQHDHGQTPAPTPGKGGGARGMAGVLKELAATPARIRDGVRELWVGVMVVQVQAQLAVSAAEVVRMPSSLLTCSWTGIGDEGGPKAKGADDDKEGKDGGKIPTRPSKTLFTELLKVAVHVNQRSLALADKDVVSSMSLVLARGYLTNITDNLSVPQQSPVASAAALQLLFDVHFLCGVCLPPLAPGASESSVKPLQRKAVGVLEAFMDPIDCAAFGPLVRERAATAALLSQSLLHCVCPGQQRERVKATGPAHTTASLLAPQAAKFSLLPMSHAPPQPSLLDNHPAHRKSIGDNLGTISMGSPELSSSRAEASVWNQVSALSLSAVRNKGYLSGVLSMVSGQGK